MAGTDDDDEDNVLTIRALTPNQAKGFVSRVYSALLLLICLVPMVSVRVLLMAGSISTFLYTRHMKPVTWVKNACVAFICCMAPAVGGITAAGNFYKAFWAPGSSCLGLTICVFLGIMHREILMDIVDVSGDAATGIETVPVKFGEIFAAKTAMFLALMMVPVCLVQGNRPFIGVIGSLRMAWKVYVALETIKHEDKEKTRAACNGAISESSTISFLCVLASFL